MSSPEGSTVTFRRRAADIRVHATGRFVRKLEREVAKGHPFDVLLTGDAELRRLNRTYRRKDYPTDVLSFPCGAGTLCLPAPAAEPPLPLGDVAISISRARRQAAAFGHSTEQEVRILILHGLLHLLGMDHETDTGRMARAEKRWRARLRLPLSLTERAGA